MHLPMVLTSSTWPIDDSEEGHYEVSPLPVRLLHYMMSLAMLVPMQWRQLLEYVLRAVLLQLVAMETAMHE